MIWPKVAIDHEMQAALKIAIHALRHADEVVFSAVIQQLEFILDEAKKEGERIKSEESQP